MWKIKEFGRTKLIEESKYNSSQFFLIVRKSFNAKNKSICLGKIIPDSWLHITSSRIKISNFVLRAIRVIFFWRKYRSDFQILKTFLFQTYCISIRNHYMDFKSFPNTPDTSLWARTTSGWMRTEWEKCGLTHNTQNHRQLVHQCLKKPW